jgi:hypothetical protein
MQLEIFTNRSPLCEFVSKYLTSLEHRIIFNGVDLTKGCLQINVPCDGLFAERV